MRRRGRRRCRIRCCCRCGRSRRRGSRAGRRRAVEDFRVGFPAVDFAGDDDGVELAVESGGGDFAALEVAFAEVGDQGDGAAPAGGVDRVLGAGEMARRGRCARICRCRRAGAGCRGFRLPWGQVDPLEGEGEPLFDVEPGRPLSAVLGEGVGDDLFDGIGESRRGRSRSVAARGGACPTARRASRTPTRSETRVPSRSKHDGGGAASVGFSAHVRAAFASSSPPLSPAIVFVIVDIFEFVLVDFERQMGQLRNWSGGSSVAPSGCVRRRVRGRGT